MERENFKSRLGFLLVSAGCAIGMGNVWKYPWLVGENGGGLFVLIYLLILICMGIPVLTMELAVGRAGRKSAVHAFQTLEPAGTKWHIHGWCGMIGNYILMMFYTTVSGWMLSYFFRFLLGTFDGMEGGQVPAIFDALLANPHELALCMMVNVIGGFLVCSIGMQKGLEKITKWMMLGLLALIVILAAHSMMLPGAGEGIKFYLMPNLERVQAIGLGHVIMAAMSQAFFTLSIGIGSIEIFGSYMSDKFTLGGEALRIAGLDTFVAIMAGLIIFPACFSYGVRPDAGPSLIFLTLPEVFLHMPAGRVWGVLFFLFMNFASFSTVTTTFENILACGMDNFGWSRIKSTWINCGILLVGSMPCVLGFNLWSDLQIIGSRGVLDSEDFIVSNLMLPIGSLIFLMFCVTKWGWGFDKYVAECNKGEGFKMPRFIKPYLQFVLPILIIIVLVQGLL